MTTALVIAGDPTMRLAAERRLAQAGWSAATAAGAASAREAFATLHPQAALIGFAGDADGTAALADGLRALGPNAAIVLLAPSLSSARLVFALTHAVDDFVPWPQAEGAIADVARANVRRRLPAAPDTPQQAGPIAVDRAHGTAHVGSLALKLRSKELDLLWELVRQAGCLCTRERLGALVWGPDGQPSARTIDVYVRRVRAAFGACGLASPIETVQGLGYRLIPPTEERP